MRACLDVLVFRYGRSAWIRTGDVKAEPPLGCDCACALRERGGPTGGSNAVGLELLENTLLATDGSA